MADFYSDMKKMVDGLTASTSQGGLGQGSIALQAITPGIPNPSRPFDPVEPTIVTTPMQGVARGISAKLVGTDVNGTILVATDLQAVCAVPKVHYKVGDVVTLDGEPVNVLQYAKIPAVGTTTAVRLILRR